MNEELPDPSASDPKRINAELMAEAERELAKRTTAAHEKQRIDQGKRKTRPADSDADTVLPNEETPRIGGTSVYRMLHPASPISAVLVSSLMAALALVAGSGIGMSMGYVATADDAHAAVAAMQDQGVGAMLRGVHFHGTNVLVYLCVMYLVHLVWSGFFRRPGQWIWWRALTLTVLVGLFAVTGQLLPMDQLALHGTNIRIGYIAETPVVGENLRALILGGSEIGSATVARAFALHAIVLPALGVVLLRRFWRDGRKAQNSRVSLLAHTVAILSVVALVLFMSSLTSAPLGLSGDLGEPYADARPEWYALPLYQLLKLMPAGVAHTLTLFAVPCLTLGGLFALPWLERVSAEPARLKLWLRVGLMFGLVSLVGLGLWPVIEDWRANDGRGSGYFARHEVADLMKSLNRRNDALGHSDAESLPPESFRHARDIWMLAQMLKAPLRSVGADERKKFPERAVLVDFNLQQDGSMDETRRKRWDKWVVELEAAAHYLYDASNDMDQRKALEKIRAVCQSCHDAYEVLEPLNPKPRGFVQAPEQTPGIKPEIKPEVRPLPVAFFDQAALKLLKAADLPGKPSDLMKRMKVCCGELMQHGGLRTATKPPTRTAEQAFADLQACLAPVPIIHDKFKDTYPLPGWRKACSDSEGALKELLTATRGEDFKAKLLKLGEACDACHKLNEEVDFRFADLIK